MTENNCIAKFISNASIKIIDECEAEMINHLNILEPFWIKESLKRMYCAVRDELCKCKRCIDEKEHVADYDRKHYEIRKKVANNEINTAQATVLFKKLMQEYAEGK